MQIPELEIGIGSQIEIDSDVISETYSRVTSLPGPKLSCVEAMPKLFTDPQKVWSLLGDYGISCIELFDDKLKNHGIPYMIEPVAKQIDHAIRSGFEMTIAAFYHFKLLGPKNTEDFTLADIETMPIPDRRESIFVESNIEKFNTLMKSLRINYVTSGPNSDTRRLGIGYGTSAGIRILHERHTSLVVDFFRPEITELIGVQ
ncbi:MAG: hypothetical protein H6799_02305 [Candidatus Nomurabacteria bacterium]|nr:MAG: hypothetical protein H6799_02305 [Candidatus Nomurabacteria bacterium]HRV75966.1 hypothetical protein [Candidatus Saccharimonadales bacterium]